MQALQEFDDIISDTTHPDGNGPPSRLRSVVTPPESATSTRIYAATEPTMTQTYTHAPPAGSVNEQVRPNAFPLHTRSFPVI